MPLETHISALQTIECGPMTSGRPPLLEPQVMLLSTENMQSESESEYYYERYGDGAQDLMHEFNPLETD
jgi:hypothetical protein